MEPTKVLFIGYPKCSTCRKCYKALQDLGIDADYRNIKEENPTADEIRHWISQGVDINQLFNTSGQLYRANNVKEKRKTYTEDQLIELLASDGMYVKRPIVIGKNQIIIGNKPDAYTSLK
jgi:arsenate reductase